MQVDLFNFHLPQELIAKRPAKPRHTARLLEVTATGHRFDHVVENLPALLRPGDVLVVNDTRVIPARLIGYRGTSRIEILLQRREGLDLWRAFARPARKLAVGQQIYCSGPETSDDSEALSATVISQNKKGEVSLQFNRDGMDLVDAINTYGRVPLPPYIQRTDDDMDRSDYQTLFARLDGAIAAPTAGLHFTPTLLAALEAQQVKPIAVTLHVGAGTFLPVRVSDTCNHIMHAEYGLISAEAAESINQRAGRVVAVGTTSLRVLESSASIEGKVKQFNSETRLFITPGYQFKVVDLLLTNFHSPRSTPFMLVAAFAGLERMQTAYAHAIAARYRFYSYGDACLLHRNEQTIAKHIQTLC